MKLNLNWLVGHGAVSVVVFLCMLGKQVRDTVERRLQTDNFSQTTEVEQAIMVEASNVSVFFSAIFFFFLGVLIVGQHIQGDLHIVQRSVLRKRLEYSMFLCLYICFFSCLFNVIQYGPQDDAIFDEIDARDTVILDIGRPIEWILTCPLMQLILPILGGEKVPDYRRFTMPANSAIILVFGCCAMFSSWLPLKLGFYFCGVFCFGVLVYQMHRTVVESTQGTETLFWGSSSIRTLAVIVTWTWVPFPIWYALSPEGFNIIQNSAAMKIAVAFLNVLSKGAFIYYLMRVRGDLEVKEMVLAEASAVNGMDKKKLGPYGLMADDDKPEDQKIHPKLAAIVFEVLQAMGRQTDFEPLKEVLESHMITTQEDLMVLTPEYCDAICLPYGFVTACKAKIKHRKVESQEKWNLTPEKPADQFDTVSVATTPLPPQVANDPRKLKEHHRRASEGGFGRSNSKPTLYDFPDTWNDGASESGRSARTPATHGMHQDEPTSPSGRPQNSQGMTREDLQAAIASSQNVLLHELRDMKRAQMEEHNRIKNLEEKVENDLDAVQGMMGGMMTQVMDKIESKIRNPSPRQPNREHSSPFGNGEIRNDPMSFAEFPANHGQNSA
jgi:bacteriorhodopsin